MSGKNHKNLHNLLPVVAWLSSILASPVASAESGEHQRLYRSAYFLGRGDAGIATADDQEAIFYNPAGLAYGKGVYKKTVLLSPHAEFSLATRDLYRKLSVEKSESVDALKNAVGKNQHLGLGNLSALVLRRAALGVITTSNLDLLVSKAAKNNALETLDLKASVNQGLTFSLAEGFWDQSLLVGITGKFLIARGMGSLSASVIDAQDIQSLQNDDNFMRLGTGSGADFGMMLRSSTGMQASFGLLVENLGGTQIISEIDEYAGETLEQTVNLGFSIKPGTKFSRVQVLADYRDLTNVHGDDPGKKLHIGTELSLKQFAGFTLGLHQGYPTGGVFLNLYFLRFDVGSYTQEMGDRAGDRPDQRFFFRLMGGF